MKYLISKLMSSKEDIITIIPSPDDLAFMKQHNISYQFVPHSEGHVTVNRKDFVDFFQLSA